MKWYRTLAFRFGVVLTVTLVTFDLLRRLVGSSIRGLLGQDWTEQTLPGILLPYLIAVALALPLAYFVAGRLTNRLGRLSRSIHDAIEHEDLSRPFQESGGDEIANAAASMNLLRERLEANRKHFALQDIRRREWIAQVSHDLRTPLTAQIACLDRVATVLSRMEPSPQREEVKRLVGVAKMDGERVHTLADDLLEIARLDAGDRLRLEPVPPGELISQAVVEVEQLAAQRGIRLEINITERLPVLWADGRRMMRAIMNLVRNAIQHARSDVEVLALRSERGVRFEVRDDGRGLPREQGYLDYLRRRGSEVRLTELARRGSRPDSAGLGLVVAQRVAEAHHGTIDAYNLSRGGAAFWIEIPVDEADTATLPSGPPSAASTER